MPQPHTTPPAIRVQASTPAAPAAVPSFLSSSLDNRQSAVDPDWVHVESQDYFMPGAGPLRALLVGAMTLLKYDPKPIARFTDCCRNTLVLHNPATSKFKLALLTCGSRHCPHCGPRYRAAVAQRVSKAIGIVKPRVWRFITLTLGHSTAPLSIQLDILASSFRRLRQSTLWQSTQLKGYGIIEVALNSSTGLWHPHLHILSRGNYIPQRQLSVQWILASSGSKIVDIRALSSSARASTYVAKYLGKTPDLLSCPTPGAHCVEYLAALRNRKMIIPFGAKVVIEDDPSSVDYILPRGDWVVLTTLQKLLERAHADDPQALAILHAIRSGKMIEPSSSFIRDG